MLDWFSNLDHKDRRALLAAGIVGMAAIIWLAIITPVHKSIERSEARFMGTLESHRYVHDISNVIVGSKAHRQSDDEWSKESVESAAIDIADPSSQVTVETTVDQQQMSVQIDALDYDQLIDLLLALESLGAFIDEAEIEPTGPQERLRVKLVITQ